MDVRRSARTASHLTLLILLGAGVCGCQSTGPLNSVMEKIANPFAQSPQEIARKKAQAIPLAQGMEITWQLKTAKEQPGAISSGKATIGPDGTVELGPYGTCKIAGLNINQAAKTVEKHLSAYITNPGVRLSTPMPEHNVEVAWRPGKSSSDTGIRRVNFQGSEGNNGGPNSGGPAMQVPGAPILDGPPGEACARQPRVDHHGPGGTYPPGYPNAPGELRRELLPPYVIGPPDILSIESVKALVTQKIQGPHLVRPDGTVGVGAYGSAMVAGLTIDQAREEIARVIHSRLDKDVVKLQDVIDGVSVDVLAYNSKVYYVITDGGGYGEQVVRVPVTGNENVLDAIGQINGLPPVASKKHIWVARRNLGGVDSKLPVDWIGITQRGDATTNYQVMPGDRIYVQSDCWLRANAVLGKVLSPFERILGITLLGSQTVNSIRSGTVGGSLR